MKNKFFFHASKKAKGLRSFYYIGNTTQSKKTPEFILQTNFKHTPTSTSENRDYFEAFSTRLLHALGQKEAEQVCRENHWFGVLAYISSAKN